MELKNSLEAYDHDIILEMHSSIVFERDYSHLTSFYQ